MKKIIISILFLCVALIGCDSPSDLIHIVEAEDFDWRREMVMSGTKTRLHIVAETSKSTISNILMTEYDQFNGDVVVFDTTFSHNEQSLNYYYNYQIPYYSDSTIMRFNSVVTLSDGTSLTYKFAFQVLPAGGKNLRSIDGITMYSSRSGKRCGFTLQDMTTVFPDILENDSLVFFLMCCSKTR